MAVRAISNPLPTAVSAGAGYSATYLKKKEEVLQERLKWAEAEIQMKYKSDVAYQQERQAAFAAIEEELAALRKEREAFAAEIAKASSKASGKTEADYRTSLMQERVKVASAIAEESTKISGQRVEILKTVQDAFTAPTGALDQATKAAQTKGRISSPQTIDTGIDAYINSPELATAFTGLTPGQKQALAVHAYREMEQQIGVIQQGVPMTEEQSNRIKQGIADRYGVPVTEQNDISIDTNRQMFTDDAMKRAGTSLSDLKKTLQYIDRELGNVPMTEEEKAAAKSAKTKAEISSETELALRALAIRAYSNDGIITDDERSEATSLINQKVAELSGKEVGTPEFEAEKKVLSRTLGFIDPSKSELDNYTLTNINDPVLQTYVREGELKAREQKLGGYTGPEQVPVPTADDLKRRAAELYYPERTQRGFGEVAPFGAPENAKTRRAFEQGEYPYNPELGTARAANTPPGPEGRFSPQPGTAGRRAPVLSPSSSYTMGVSQDVLGYTRAAREAITAAGGKFNPQALDQTANPIYEDIAQRYKQGQIKFDELYDAVSASTTGDADMTATLGGVEAAKKAKDQIMYNIIGTQYEQFLANQPKSSGNKMNSSDYANEEGGYTYDPNAIPPSTSPKKSSNRVVNWLNEPKGKAPSEYANE